MKKRLLGVLGGLGPMSTFYFCELLTAHTQARCDAEHIDMIVSSRASTPDRTAFILGRSSDSPLPAMREESARLVSAGAGLIVIPCNTAHYFYHALAADCPVPMLNIISETVRYLQLCGVRRFGLLATEGTVRSGAYQRFCEGSGLECLTPTDSEQEEISRIIYGSVKQNKPADLPLFRRIADSLHGRGCEAVVLGCTELSLLRGSVPDRDWIIDSLEVLACRTILECGKEPVGFPAGFDVLRESIV